jgi:platelet-activating factor acetylhydrolase IB subunit alpha
MVYDDESLKKKCELRGHDHVIETLAFLTCAPPSKSSKDSGTKITSKERRRKDENRDYLASGSRDRTVKLWSIKSASCLMSFEAHENWVRGVLIHPNGRFIISCGDDRSI